MAHPAFEEVKEESGLFVWRVEQMDLSAVCKTLQGNFFTGDSYLILQTLKPGSSRIFVWHGAEASQDEKACAAIFMVQLDDFLGGHPTQYIEHQGAESTDFVSLFKGCIKYKPGGVKSGFNHVEKTEDKRLLHVKGRRTVRATEVPMSWSSFNRGDCFIIVLGQVMYHWAGSECNMFERIGATRIAIDIRDGEYGGQPELEMIKEGEEPEDVIAELGPKPELPAPHPDSDEQVNRGSKPTLYMISDASGTMKSTLVCDKSPFEQEKLKHCESYILDNSCNNMLYVWKGKESNQDERKAAITAAEKFIEEKHYSKNLSVRVLADGAEDALFKQFFTNWLDKYETTLPSEAYVGNRIAKVEQIPFDYNKLHSDDTMAAQHGMVDDGSGEVQIWRVEGGDKVAVDPSSYGQFFGGDCYLVLYTYNAGGRKKFIIYTWQGQKSSQDELGASAFLTVTLDDSMDGVATQVRVTQGKEPSHLLSIFKDKALIIHRGGTSRDCGQSEAAPIRLFHIRQSSTKATRAVEVEPVSASLNTNDVFVMKSSPKGGYIWKGNGGTEEEMAAAKYVATQLGGDFNELEESNEPVDFWESLGGKTKYQTSLTLQRTSINPPRLFCCSNKIGRFNVEEVPGDFNQMDLAPDDVMLLDTCEQLFIWIGKDANEAEKKESASIAEKYLEADPSGRRGISVCTIKQGDEPRSFTGWFHAWDYELWDKDQSQLMQSQLSR